MVENRLVVVFSGKNKEFGVMLENMAWFIYHGGRV